MQKSIKSIFRIKRKWPLLILLLALLVVIFTNYLGLIINITSSMKNGLYIKQSSAIKHGDIVSFCLSSHAQHIGLSQHYLQRGSGCDGSNPLIKQVIAIPGDDVVLAENYIAVNYIKHFYKTYHEDSFNSPLMTYPRGIYKNTQGYWLIGVNDSKSWDSRYWGPISEKQIRHKLKPIVTW